MAPHNPLIGEFHISPILTPEMGEAGLPHLQAQTKWLYLDCNQVFTAKEFQAVRNYMQILMETEHESNQTLYK